MTMETYHCAADDLSNRKFLQFGSQRVAL